MYTHEGRYTLSGDDVLENSIKEQLQTITNTLLDKYGKVIEAIILCGGFGRGEGSYTQDNDNVARAHNDFDIVLVTRKRISQSELKTVGQELASRVGIRFIDLGSVRRSQLSKLSPSVFTYDLHASQLLYGDASIMDELPQYGVSDIPIRDAEIQIQNRLICFMEKTPEEFWIQQDCRADKMSEFVLQISKAIIAATIARLVEQKKYVSSYREQNSLVHSLGFDQKREELIEQAYLCKLGNQSPTVEDVRTWYCAALTYFLETYRLFLPTEWDEYYIHNRSYYSSGFIALIKKYIKFFRYREHTVSPAKHIKIEFEAYTLLQDIHRCLIDEQPITKQMMGRIDRLNQDWQLFHH